MGSAVVIPTIRALSLCSLLPELTFVFLSGEREIGTEGKILLLAREDKKLQGVGLQSRQLVRRLRVSVVLQNTPLQEGMGTSTVHTHWFCALSPVALPCAQVLLSIQPSGEQCLWMGSQVAVFSPVFIH